MKISAEHTGAAVAALATKTEDEAPRCAPVRFSEHARRRAARRNVVPDAVDYVLEHGRCYHRTGVVIYFLARRDIRSSEERKRAARLEGTVVLVSRDGAVITVYRNRGALKTILRKTKYRHAAHGSNVAAPADAEETLSELAWQELA